MSDRVAPAQATDESRPSLRRNRNFLRLLFGRLVTNAGDSLYAVAAMWFVYELTGSTVYTGIAESLLLLPLVLQFLSGPLVDRWPIVRALVSIQLVQALAVLSLPVAAHTGNLTVELLLVTIPLLALLNQFVYPAQSAALPRIVSDDQLTRANSAFSFTLHGLDMLFEALGGMLIALVGAASLFVLDSVTFVVAALSFVGVRLPPTESPVEGADEIDVSEYLADMADGVRCLRGSVFVEMTLATMVVNFGTGMTLAVLPSFADLRAGPALFGAMLGALGVGRVLGAAVAPKLETVKLGHVKIVGSAGGCLLWLGAVYAPWPPLAVGLFALAWVPAGVSNVMGNTLEQTVTPNRLLGRVASVTASASTLTLPVGALLGGVAGSVIGTPSTMAIAGSTLGFASLVYAVRPRLRRLPAMNDIDPEEFDIGLDSPPESEESDGG
ncbi:MFS transporter [Haladaptatus salinisoli]|uniref:MFS transporter n=1 Tax=Haladaptatus salinisoli TaxID=2884876 RepID=UPI001D0A3AD0|nr:MFS transporter [Haladaptatus salinisoli]